MDIAAAAAKRGKENCRTGSVGEKNVTNSYV